MGTGGGRVDIPAGGLWVQFLPVFELEVPGISLHLEQWQAICARKRAWLTGGKQNRDIKSLLLAS